MSTLHYDLELEELRQRASGRLLTVDAFDVAAFEALREYIAGKANDLREKSVLSKQLLSCLREATKAIESRAAYVPAVREHQVIANEFELLLDLLIASESPDDRKRGAPRII